MAEKQHFIPIIIEGLESQSDDGSVSNLAQCEVTLDANAPISEIWTKIEELGYIRPAGLFNLGPNPHRWSSHDTNTIRTDYREVTVVGPEEPSNYHHNVININDNLISFANQRYQGQSQLRFELQPEIDGAKGAGAQKLVVDDNLEIVFHRTLRMPDDNRFHQLPASLGNFPLFNVEAYVGRLPPTMLEQGGIFFPMWQREAMWIGFHLKNADPDLCYAVRIFVGHINAVTGLPMKSANEKDAYGISKQDYVVVPGQPWIDGIYVSAGVVRQFVAMPLGSGYSVEGQVTGKEKFGGLQIEIIPGDRRHLEMWVLASEPGEPEQVGDGYRAGYHTPAELGLRPSDKLRTYSNLEVPLKVSDLAGRTSSAKIHLGTRDKLILLDMPHRKESWRDPPLVPEVPNSPQDDDNNMRSESGVDDETSVPRGNDNSDYHQDKYEWKKDRPRKGRPGVKYYIDPETYSISIPDNNSNDHQDNHEPRTPLVNTRDMRAMGLAAGGKMIQDIVRDDNHTSTWNVSNATLMNVHIVDPATCEQVTHIVQEPPIDAQAYIDADLPFFVIEENVENRLDKGDFEQVISVSEMDKKVGVTTEPNLDPNKPKMCEECSLRLCDCIIRPCEHQFCNVCIRELECVTQELDQGQKHLKCPRCNGEVHYVAGFSAPMNIPGEESLKVNVPVTVLKASSDGRPVFQSIYTTRI